MTEEELGRELERLKIIESRYIQLTARDQMNETERNEFQQIANNLRVLRVSLPVTVTHDATMLSINLHSWLGQIVGRIEGAIR